MRDLAYHIEVNETRFCVNNWAKPIAKTARPTLAAATAAAAAVGFQRACSATLCEVAKAIAEAGSSGSSPTKLTHTPLFARLRWHCSRSCKALKTAWPPQRYDAPFSSTHPVPESASFV